jgi:pimeloyl-ACP methyl ester carboxylesterase
MLHWARDGTAYEIFGDSDAALVLVHGLGLNRNMWQWQAPSLAARYTVVTYDLYGHGESPPPPGEPNLALFADQLRRLMDELALPKAAVVGFSLGGMIVRRFALDQKERLWALAILHSPHRRDEAARQAIQARVEQARKDGPAATVDAALVRWFTDGYRSRNPAVMKLVRGWVMANRPDIYPAVYQVLVDGVDELIAPEPAIACPTLVMTGEEDYGNSPAMSAAIAAEIPNARLVILSGLRHMALAEAPCLVNHALEDFLAEAAGERAI